jgi:hypothetical protein
VSSKFLFLLPEVIASFGFCAPYSERVIESSQSVRLVSGWRHRQTQSVTASRKVKRVESSSLSVAYAAPVVVSVYKIIVE